ncbi:biotin--[acetyl-CoA-carboxylase] ligase [Pseudoclavibacter sp. 13-3]|uniref:biotin--[acetyl-CoA-carboxylase] ligase n=1 Tax=Pseudoclavibacter sp. 13-3 TaxID=2901228 RepID=UPI001E35D85B|nr:biotin--[acetyl-CoA-carboxylase] ligase [Pseudoclavibacter sp. 13-3]MCD7102369.1 biotin--[acetyl-CoA-carboxylase] ligase [Pseudoclavibacter sp. 13-3]
MDFPLSGAELPNLIALDHVESTNSVLSDLIRTQWADGQLTEAFTAVATLDQRGGRGRLNRVWQAPRGSALAVSIAFVVPAADVDLLPWLPLICGAAAQQAMQQLGVHAGVKWPNDLLVEGRKVCGILSELVSTAPRPGQQVPTDLPVLVGFGINLVQTAADFEAQGLDPETVTSLAREGAAVAGDVMLQHLLVRLKDLWARALRHDASVFDAVRDACVTIGQRVRVMLPGGGDLVGVATGLDAGGRLLVESDGTTHALSVGDVIHVRPAAR